MILLGGIYDLISDDMDFMDIGGINLCTSCEM